MQDDSRQMQRFSIAMPAQISVKSDSPTKPSLDLFSRDVCSGGAFFVTEHPLDVGTKLMITMTIQPQHFTPSKGKQVQVNISGEVLRKEIDGMAVRFDRSYKMSTVGC